MKRISLAKIFFIGFIILIVVPVIGVNILINNRYRESLSKQYTGQIELSLTQTKVGLEDDIKRMSLATSVLVNDEELMEDLENWALEEDKYEKFSLSQSIDKRLNYMFSYSSDVNSLQVIFTNGLVYYYRSNMDMEVEEFRRFDWYQELINKKGQVQTVNYGSSLAIGSDYIDVLSAAISPKPITLNKSIEMVYVEIISPTMKAITTHDQDMSYYYVLDENCKIMVESKNTHQELDKLVDTSDCLKENELTNESFHDQYNISLVSSEKNNWKIAYIEDQQVIQSSLDDVLSIFYVVYSILVISLISYMMILYWSSLKPISHLMKTMKKIEQGDIQVKAKVAGPMETRNISLAFNRMMERIHNLMKERDVKEQQRLEEEKKALQAQINPHFIYNTLNSIKIMAMMSKANNIKKMLESFMKMIELNFKNKGSMILIKDELEYLQAYINIMNVRYGNFIDVKFEVSEELEETYIMQMIMQPLIENTVVHGLKDKVDGLINIRMTPIDDLRFAVVIEDNGLGIDSTRIPELLRKSNDDRNHIGISNVKRRIEITYGPDYSLNIESEVDKYTRIEVVLPILLEGGEDSV